VKKIHKYNPTFFLGPLDLIGYYSSLARGLREIGCKAHILHTGNDSVGRWNTDSDALPIRWYVKSKHHFDATRSLSRLDIGRYFPTIQVLFSQLILVMWVALTCDVIVMKSGESITHSRADLKLFKLLGKKIVITYHGSDSRPPYMSGASKPEDMRQVAARTVLLRERVLQASGLADVIFESPLSAQFQVRRCCLVQALGPIIDETRMQPGLEVLSQKPAPSPSVPIRILHAPSNPLLKGSDIIANCVEKLRSEGFNIDYVTVKNRPNSDVIKEIALCDFVIDELYSDAHGAYFSIEALAFGRPVVVCGYGKEELSRFIPDELVVPTEYTHPKHLEESVRHLITDLSYRQKRGEEGILFTQRQTNAVAAAKNLLTVIFGQAPSSWFFDPQDLRYVHGAAASDTAMQKSIADYIKVNGEGSLFLDDKPELKKAVIQFATGNATPTSDAQN